MHSILDKLFSNKPFFYITINNIFLVTPFGLLFLIFKNVYPDMLIYFFLFYIIIYIANLLLLTLNSLYFNIMFDVLTNKNTQGRFYNIRKIIPFTNIQFLSVMGLSYLFCYLSHESPSISLHYFHLILDIIRIFLIPGLLYYSFITRVNNEKLFSILIENNYLAFKSYSALQMRQILEFWAEYGRKWGTSMPQDRYTIIAAIAFAFSEVGLVRGEMRQDEVGTKLDKAAQLLEEQKNFICQNFPLTSVQKREIILLFETARKEMLDYSNYIDSLKSPELAVGWYSGLFGEGTESWQNLRLAVQQAEKIRAAGLKQALDIAVPRHNYPAGSLGDIKNKIDEITIEPTYPNTSVKPNTCVESTYFILKKVISFFSF